VDISDFLSSLESFAVHHSGDRPEWKKWTIDSKTTFWKELPPLIQAERCKHIQDPKGLGRVLIVDFYVEIVSHAYDNLEKAADQPFPDEHTFKLQIPQDQLRVLSAEEDMGAYLETPQPTRLPILKITFIERISPAMALSSHIPRRLLEAAVLKLHNYLGSHNNRDYFFNKLVPQMQGKEPIIREILGQLEKQPLDCLNNLESPGEVMTLFWAYFYSIIKNEVRKKHDLVNEDVAACQSAALIHSCVTYYRKKAAKAKEREIALMNLDSHFEKAPYLFKMKDIVEFTDGSGHVLLEQYGEEDLRNALLEKSTEGNGQELPPLLILRDQKDEQVFVLKNKIFPICLRLISEIRPLAQKAVFERWLKMIQNFKTEPSMEKDEEFEKLLFQYANELSPMLFAFLKDKKLPQVQNELEATEGMIPLSSKFYDMNGKRLPMETLLLINRRDILNTARATLPFWYSTPFISSLMAFFMEMKRKSKKAVKPSAGNGDTYSPEEGDKTGSRQKPASMGKEIKALAAQYQSMLVPAGSTPDAYLMELESSWRKIVKKDERQALVADIKSLVRDRLRRTMRLQHARKLTLHDIGSLANSIVLETPSLKNLATQESLVEYIKILIVQLLSTMK
jgi:hypothetical protein